jgi:hypothetical protein
MTDTAIEPLAPRSPQEVRRGALNPFTISVRRSPLFRIISSVVVTPAPAA